ncbi:MAG TPA: TIGR00159 family protein [Rikenellaceae bacterium]|nr:TIGR00159 family protein [Rikenellaceae bacterium]HCZ22221.1 TIGR00159 family protein [Rikenellaceae bacterium]
MLGFLNFTLTDLLDIVMVAVIIYLAFRWIKGSNAINIFIAIIIVLLVQIVSSALGMKMLSSILGTLIDVGAVAIIVIFQPEIRRFLNNIGRHAGDSLEKRPMLRRLLVKTEVESVDAKSVTSIAQACQEMSEQKTGALIIIRHKDLLQSVIDTGDIIDAEISSRLIMNIFFKNSPLHDGAMVIGDNRIIAARCTLPITERTDLPARLGMRHKAAVGISEQCDASVIVVSEQTGKISYVKGGDIKTVDSINKLKLLLSEKSE